MRIVSLVTALVFAATGTTAHAAPVRPVKPKSSAPSWAPFGMKPCKVEDADGPCYWDASVVVKGGSNGVGLSFYVVPLGKGKVSLNYPSAPWLNDVVPTSY